MKVAQVEERFCKSIHLIAAQLVSCTHSKFIKLFPRVKHECAIRIWPVANKVQLETELQSLYTLDACRKYTASVNS